MDRFIGVLPLSALTAPLYLKSNMDRFIVHIDALPKDPFAI